MANEQNLLRPKRDQTAKQRRESASKAGKASGAARRKRKNMQELARLVLSMPLREGDTDEVAFLRDIYKLAEDGTPIIGDDGKPLAKNLTVEQAALMAQANKAIKGDSHALAFLRDTAGERPVEQIEVSTDVKAATEDIRNMIEDAKKKRDG